MRGLRNYIQRRRRIELGVSYSRGERDGFAAARPFQGVVALARFPEDQPAHTAVIKYERELLDALPMAYDRIRTAKRDFQHGPNRASPEYSSSESSVEAAQADRDELIGELERVRGWLDAFVNSAEEYAAARPDRRGQILPPPLPLSARGYESIEAFVAESRERGVPDWETRKVATGADFGYDWTWQDPTRPWVISTWRVSYIDELKEVYACENPLARYTPFISFDGEDKRARSVWLLVSDFEFDPPSQAREDRGMVRELLEHLSNVGVPQRTATNAHATTEQSRTFR
jgi:hypothetical protein